MSIEDDYRVKVWSNTATYHREHGRPIAAKLAAAVADAIRYYLVHLGAIEDLGEEVKDGE